MLTKNLISRKSSRTINIYIPKDEYTVLKIRTKNGSKEDKVTEVIVDNDCVDRLAHYIWSVKDYDGKPVVISYNHGKVTNIRSVVLENINLKTLSKNGNPFDARKQNCTTKVSETIIAKKISESQKNLDPIKKANIRRAIQDKRYSSDYSKKLAESKLGANNPSTILNKDLVNKIRALDKKGIYSHQEIADILNLNRNTVTDIIGYKTWNEFLRLDTVSEEENNFAKSVNMREYKNTDYLDLDFNLFNDVIKFISTEFIVFVINVGGNQLYIEVQNKEGVYQGSTQLLVNKERNFRCKTNYSIINIKTSKTRTGLKLNRKSVYILLNNIIYSI